MSDYRKLCAPWPKVNEVVLLLLQSHNWGFSIPAYLVTSPDKKDDLLGRVIRQPESESSLGKRESEKRNGRNLIRGWVFLSSSIREMTIVGKGWDQFRGKSPTISG